MWIGRNEVAHQLVHERNRHRRGELAQLVSVQIADEQDGVPGSANRRDRQPVHWRSMNVRPQVGRRHGSRCSTVVTGDEQRYDVLAIFKDYVPELARPERAGVAIDDSRQAIGCGNLVRRSVEQHTIDAVEPLCRLFERHGRSDLAMLQRAVPVVASRIPRERIDGRHPPGQEYGAAQSDREHHASGEHEPSARERPARSPTRGGDTQLVAHVFDEIGVRLEIRGPPECGAQRVAELAAHPDLFAAGRTRIEVLKDLVVRFRQQFVAQE
jgi:hypothetical protein